MSFEPGGVRLLVSDDGEGFAPASGSRRDERIARSSRDARAASHRRRSSRGPFKAGGRDDGRRLGVHSGRLIPRGPRRLRALYETHRFRYGWDRRNQSISSVHVCDDETTR